MDRKTMLALCTSIEEMPGPESHVLARCKHGGPEGERRLRCILENLVAILDLDSRWEGRLTYTKHDSKHRLDGAPLRDCDEGAAALWLSRTYNLVASSAAVGEAMRLVAGEHPIDPVIDYLGGLQWDGVPRLDGWLERYLGVDKSPIVAQIGRCFALGAVARAMRPGCKVDTVLVLVGGQGRGKSQAIAVLGAPWHGDTPIDPDSKDAYQQLSGCWIYELAEIDAFSRKDQARIKALISSPIDRYRPAYGRNVVDCPRRTVFVGTTNKVDFLADPTGSRRYMPVSVGCIDLAALRADRDQLWAEAVAAYEAGEPWWLAEEAAAELTEASASYRSEDPWHSMVAKYCDEATKGQIEIADVLSAGLCVPYGQQSKVDEQRVAAILRDLGYARTRPVVDGRRLTVWARA